VDWDQDGKLDILSGCYWTEGAEAGHIQLLTGKGGIDFEEAVSLKNMAGKPLENIVLEGEDENQILSICTQQHAVDYDGDNDLDLVVGCFGPKFYLYENKADSENGEQSLVEQPVELSIESTGYHSAPHLVDWDDDGDLDLLSGSSDGGVLLSENTGTREEPQWAAFKQLVPPSELHEQSTDDGGEIQMSPSTRVWATDWNGDGLLDLLVGDSASVVNAKPGISPSVFQKRRKEHEQKMAAIGKKQQALMPEYEEAMEAGEEPDAELEAKMEEISEELMEIYKSTNEFQTSERTGFVWLLIRKPTTAEVSTEVPIADGP
jgi:hypothetical protein